MLGILAATRFWLTSGDYKALRYFGVDAHPRAATHALLLQEMGVPTENIRLYDLSLYCLNAVAVPGVTCGPPPVLDELAKQDGNDEAMSSESEV